VTDNDPTRAKALGVAVIYQQPALFPDLTVAENIALRLERGGPFRLINWRRRRRRAAELLARVGATISPDAVVRDLTMPEQQLVEIASALGGDARILILDEPTASLSDREVDNLFRVIRELRQQGVGMIYISHRLEELPQIADRVTVLRDGAYVATRAMADVDRAEMIRLMVGRSLDAVFPKIDVPLGNVVLETRDLACRESGVRGINLAVRAGEILGLAGLVGAGRTELARVLFGLTPATSGQILLKGQPVHVTTPAAAVKLGIAYVPEDRRRHGVILDMPVAANATLAVLRRITRLGLIDRRREREIATDFVTRLAVKTPSINTPVGNLSGGNQQKVALARWLAAKPTVLILDEPTQGVDVGARAEIYGLVRKAVAGGASALVVASDFEELAHVCDRAIVLRAGRVVGEVREADLTAHRLTQMTHQIGGR
jgi:rhamnose transport system ATP-binding protein